jgi:hypothetical protein
MTLVTLVRLARRRLLGNELLSQGANASSAALCALILLLLLGTQILSWQWAVTIPLAALAAGLYQVRRRLPSSYAVAQMVDHRMELADTLSTALYFSQQQASSPATQEVRRTQFQRADELAQSVDVRRAVPYIMPRTIYLMAALFLVASSLFALRYGLSRRLDLKRPLASMLPESFGGGKPAEHAKNARRNPKRDLEVPYDSGAATDNQDQNDAGQPDSTESLDTANEPDPESNVTAPSKSGDGKKQADQPDDKMAGDDRESAGDGKSDGNSDDPSGEQGDNKSNQSQNQPDSKQDASSAGESSSLMSKVKDAMQNLFSRKPQQNQSKSGEQQNAMDQKGNQSKGQQNGGKQQSKDGQQQNGNQQGESQDGQNGEEAKNSDNAQGKGTGKSDSPQASKQPGSGIGSQDGDKAIKNAEQLAAMGKISEILGKRSANITGEATVEVQTTSQQLHTPYAQRANQHSQGGAEISRDEIPVSLQPYIQQYFEQVRKRAASTSKK